MPLQRLEKLSLFEADVGREQHTQAFQRHRVVVHRAENFHLAVLIQQPVGQRLFAETEQFGEQITLFLGKVAEQHRTFGNHHPGDGGRHFRRRIDGEAPGQFERRMVFAGQGKETGSPFHGDTQST